MRATAGLGASHLLSGTFDYVIVSFLTTYLDDNNTQGKCSFHGGLGPACCRNEIFEFEHNHPRISTT